MAIEIPCGAFFNAAEKPAEFQGLLRAALREKRGLAASLGDEHVMLRLCDAGAAPRLVGTWRASEFRAVQDGPIAARLFLPFLFATTGISLPHDHVLTLGHDYRSVADFFLRNLVMAVSRGSAIACDPTSTGNLNGRVRDLQRHYVYIFKAFFPEPCLADRDAQEALEFLLANAYVPLFDYENPLLRQGTQYLRGITARPVPAAQTGMLKSELLQAREKMLEHLGG